MIPRLPTQADAGESQALLECRAGYLRDRAAARELAQATEAMICRTPYPRPSAAVLALQAIARGRTDNGRPMSAEAARQIARVTLTAINIGWVLPTQGGREP